MPDGKRKNIYSGFFFLSIGIAICIGAWKIGILKGHVPKAGFMPFLAGIVISGLSLLLLFFAIFERKGGEEEEAETIEVKTIAEKKESSRRIGLAIFALFFPIFLMNFLGFFITICLFLLFMFKLIERQKWRTSAFTSLPIALGFYILFQVLLEIPFPKGIFGF